MESRLTYLEDAGFIQYKKCRAYLVKCRCSCGNIVTIRKYHFKNNHTKSCGCLQKELIGSVNRTHGLTNSSTYRSWCSMMTRCTNPKVNNYHNYGGRGIKVCDRWHNFELFLLDMGEKPSDNLQLNRIDNNGNYEKDNCKWVDSRENCNNKNNNVKYNYKGELLTVTEISRRSGINRTRISNWKNRSKYSQEKIEALIKKLSK